MRDIQPTSLAKLGQHLGTKPALVLEIQWVEGGQRHLYTDRIVAGTSASVARILSISAVDSVLKLTGTDESMQVTVVLDDHDGTLKTLMDAHDIHKRPCWVYQWFEGIPLADKFLLFKGEITSPVTWDEGDRTLTFDVLTQIEDVEVGFSMEEGQFPNVPAEALGKAWPLVFGTVCHMQAVQVRSPRKGMLLHGEGIHDFTLENRICQAKYLTCPTVPLGETSTISPKVGEDGETIYETDTEQKYGPDPECVLARHNTVCELEVQLAQQMEYEHLVLTILDGDKFPQRETVTLNINGAIFTGRFGGGYYGGPGGGGSSSNTFRIETREHPEFADTTLIPCKKIGPRGFGKVPTYYGLPEVGDVGDWGRWAADGTVEVEGVDVETSWKVAEKYLPDESCTAGTTPGQGAAGGPSAAQAYLDSMPTSSFCWLPAGSEVYLEAEAEVLYIVSLLSGTINSVAAYKKLAQGSRLMTVPEEYYTVYNTNYGGYTVTEIGFTKPLSQIDEDWSDEIYVSFTSSVGPNPVDIILYLLGKYTTLVADTTSFLEVHEILEQYPCNFAVKSRLSLRQLLQDIAYQSRCALYVRDGTVYLKYLAQEPTPVGIPARILTSADILQNTFKVTLTPTEEVVTKHVAEWQSTEALPKSEDAVRRKVILKYNVSKYGVREQTVDYYTHNTYPDVLKTATFWLIRTANTWKRIAFDTPLSQLDLEPFDCVTVDVAQLCAVPVKCIVTKAQYDSGANVIHFECWTPIRAGEAAPYVFAWPAGLNSLTAFPPSDDIYAGSGYAFTVEPPTGHILASGEPITVSQSNGDPFPSDTGDTLTTVECYLSDEFDIEEPEPVFEAWEAAKRAVRSSLDDKMNHGSPSGPSDQGNKKEREKCGDPDPGAGCIYEVTVTYTTGWLFRPCGDLGPCHADKTGGACAGSTEAICYVFDSCSKAAMFQNQIKGEMDPCGLHGSGESYPTVVSAIKQIADPEDKIHLNPCEC